MRLNPFMPCHPHHFTTPIAASPGTNQPCSAGMRDEARWGDTRRRARIVAEEMQAGLDLLPTWALEQKAAASRQVIAVMRQCLAAGEQVARMYQEPGLARLKRQAEVMEDLVAKCQAATKRTR